MAAPQPAGAAYLTLARILGDPRSLLDGYLRSSEVMTEVGRDHALILHAAAQTEEPADREPLAVPGRLRIRGS